MLKNILTLYIVCFGCYVLFTREPDFFESEKIPATIQPKKFNNAAVYTINNKTYYINADYLFSNYHSGEIVEVIYNPQKPEQASINTIWGYWLRWQELLVSTFLIVGLYYLATSIIQNPDPESLLQQIDDEDKPQRKYT